MIYTVTFNPAIDYNVFLDHLHPGDLNRCTREAIRFGGKGVNVSVVLRRLAVDSTALGFIAGFTGLAIDEELRALGIRTDFILLSEGVSRINVKIHDGCQTEINAQGPNIDPHALKALFDQLDKLLPGDTLVLAGSVPPALPDTIYGTILARLAGRGIQFVVDAAGGLLRNVFLYRPFLIKPNRQELGGLIGAAVRSKAEAVAGARKLQDMGARNVLVSLGEDGALLLAESGDVLFAAALGGKGINAVGAGDSLVAGFLAGYQTRGDPAHALALGSAAAGATACSEELAQRDTVFSLLSKAKIETIC